MNITIAQAVNLKSELLKKISYLDNERGRVATEVVDKGEEAQIPERNVDVISSEIAEVQDDYLDLSAALRAINQVTYVTWDGVQIPLSSALDRAKLIREEAANLKRLGSRKKIERSKSGSLYAATASNTYSVALYEPADYKAAGEKKERLANKLSTDIEKANHRVEFNFPAAAKYLEQ